MTTSSPSKARLQTRPSIVGLATWWWPVCVLAMVPLWYWLTTGQVWEDFLITFRASHNLAIGNGLTYEAGTRVHCFTSPLNALLPALFDWLTRTDSYALPLALYTIVALGAFTAGGCMIVRLMRESGTEFAGAAFVFPLLLVNCDRTTAFVVNGQEAGLWVGFLAFAFAGVVRGHERHWFGAGLSWAGLMWTRPDSPVHIVVLALTSLIFASGTRRAEFTGLLRAAGLCALLYLPWFAWAWWYYGSPVPHSLQAKIGAYVGPGLPWPALPLLDRARDVFAGFVAPIYGLSAADWGAAWLWSAALLGGVAAVAFLIPGVSRLTRCASMCFLGSVAYLAFVWSRGTAFPWYYVPACLFGSIVLARLPFELIPSRRIGWLAALVPLVIAAQFFIAAQRLAVVEQRVIEDGVRKPLGLWLRQEVRPGERVFLEPIGYIGYYSGALLYDYPGLASPAVVRLRRQGLGFADLIETLRPTWLVLRKVEAESLRTRPGLLAQYKMAVEVDEGPALNAYRGLRGRGSLADAMFYVLVRVDRPAGKMK